MDTFVSEAALIRIAAESEHRAVVTETVKTCYEVGPLWLVASRLVQRVTRAEVKKMAHQAQRMVLEEDMANFMRALDANMAYEVGPKAARQALNRGFNQIEHFED